MHKFFAALLLGFTLATGAVAQTAITQPYTVTVTVTPALSAVNLSGTTVTVSPNAGAVVGAVSCTTNPPGGNCAGPITLGGANASSFALTNGGMIPTNLVVGATSLPAGSYAVTLSASK